MMRLERLSELEKAIRRQPDATPDELMEDLAEQLSLEAEVDPPVDLRLLASLQAIGEVQETLIPQAGCLINDGGRLRIEVSALDSPERQNFTIGHEISHTLLPGFTMTRNFRCNPGATKPRPTAELKVEYLADVGASELLLPRRFVSGLIAEQPFGWPTIEDLATHFRASLVATARRYVRLAGRPAFFASLELATSRADPVPTLRVKNASWSPDLTVFIPPNKSVGRSHPTQAALLGEDVDTVTEMRSLRLPGRYRVIARPYPYAREGETVMRVLALGLMESEAHRGHR